MGHRSPVDASEALRIVGIGASAGGLVALEEFLHRIPADGGMACIVVQHLDPTQKGLLPELLQRVTDMPVCAAEQGMRIEPGHVYVIPPNTELTLVGTTLHLAEPAEPRGMRLPVNILFSSLASGQGERAIGVVLSGMGSDGTAGLQAIKAVGGLTAVQDPESAQFDSMPRSAIKAGCADIVATPSELPGRILAVMAHPSETGAGSDETPPPEAASPLERIVTLLQQRIRHDFSLYKPSTLKRRAERRMAIHGLASLEQYAEFVEHNSQEGELLFKELLIGVTSFFRDAATWEYLAGTALPELLERRKGEDKLRAWVIGCSTGEEAYSLAMVFTEVMERAPDPHGVTLQIFASDLSPDGIATARRGQYPLSIADDVSPERLARFFTAHERYYQINQDIRDMVLFAQHDVILDPPFTKLDLIACRNLLIYFGPVLQRRLLPLFHYILRPGGVLFLGTSETVGQFNHLFTPIESRLRFYQRQDHAPMGGRDFLLRAFPPLSGPNKEHPVSSTEVSSRPTDELQAAADQVLLQVYAPAAVVLNGDGDIVYISGHTGKYLEPAAGKANWNIFAMAREGLGGPLASALKKAATGDRPVHLHSLEVPTHAGVQRVDVTVHAFHDPSPLRGMTMVIFRDLAPSSAGHGGRSPKGKGGRPAAHAAELQQYRAEIESLREEARTSRQESQAANEELQSANEELQSTNEELNSSKEEMQSMNEELQTINAELQAKLDDLALAQSDMQNVLNSIEIAILFLDQNLDVRRYTDQAAKIFRLRESDVGRPLSDLTTSLEYPELQEDARHTLRTLASTEKQVTTDDSRWFTVRIMPYRRVDNVIDGVVITMVDITETKRLEAALRD
ncbi:chemotaxis protein CheB [Thioalkalivibrio sp. AKL19]|uniref:chemotaxis protein CheB n=1 Tax=Thioalkalivibrio sp. AKL19 TaxID=1266914 RepID=UPI000400A553|nr:chemotaxis protein CheB [Thioalkalivibrio sp. AKL19]